MRTTMVNLSLKVVLDIRDFNTLNDVLVCILSDPSTDATFLNAFFIKQFLEINRKVLLVSFQDINIHYQGVCQDMLCDVKSATQKGMFKFIDGLLKVQENMNENVNNILNDVFIEIESFAQNKQILVVIDGLSVLSDIGVNDSNINHWIMKLTDLLKDKFISTLLVNQKKEMTIPSPLSYYLSIQSDINIHLKPLSTGYNKNVTAEMSVVRRYTRDFHDVQKTRFLYSTKAKNIECDAWAYSNKMSLQTKIRHIYDPST